jgi:predicted nucleic acid-binding protein
VIRVVIDTNVFVSAMRLGGGAVREIIRRALNGICCPLFSNALWLEYEGLPARRAFISAKALSGATNASHDAADH